MSTPAVLHEALRRVSELTSATGIELSSVDGPAIVPHQSAPARRKRVLLLGAGYVSKPVVGAWDGAAALEAMRVCVWRARDFACDLCLGKCTVLCDQHCLRDTAVVFSPDYLLRDPVNEITVASVQPAEAKALCGVHARLTPVTLDVNTQGVELDALVAQHDVIISLVPAPSHPTVADSAIRHKKNMVRAPRHSIYSW